MRNLTIKREKSFVGCLSRVKVYIEDPASSDIEIGGVYCRKLGTLKNGEEKSFQIEERAVRLYIIAGKVSKNICNELFDLPAGSGDVRLCGSNQLNPANGNAFRFDNNDTEATKENRSRGMKKGIVVLALSLVAGAIIGAAIPIIMRKGSVKDKTFTASGMSITLTNEFITTDELLNCVAGYESANVAVMVMKEKYDNAPGFKDLTPKEYGELCLEAGGRNDISVKENDGMTYCEYKNKSEVNGIMYQYYGFFYKSSDSYWTVTFASSEKYAEKNSDVFLKWAKTVTFEN